MTYRIALATALAVLTTAAPAGAQDAVARDAATCRPRVDAKTFASAATLRTLTKRMDAFGEPRATGNAAHRGFVDWLDGQLRAVPGVHVRSITYPIKRWDARRTALTVDGTRIPVAAPVPYSRPTGARGTTAPLAYVPAGTPITAANAQGRIVVRELAPGSVPYSVFAPGALGVGGYDPTGLLTSGTPYTRDFLAPVQPELTAASDAGAAGILFLRTLPRKQQKDFYAPYEGLVWKVPGAYLGADEAAKVRAALADGKSASATLTVDAKLTPVRTRTLVATIPGATRERLVVDSHTDGTNAVEDNGPIAMLAMARALAKRPLACREKTVELAMVTGHFYQHLLGTAERDGGSEQIAKGLDRDYDKGTVAGVLVLEHLGALSYDPVPRRDGGPGRELVRTTRHEPALVGVTDSVPLRKLVIDTVTEQKIDGTAVIVGADAPDTSRVPQHCSFGGEGTPYNHHILPTVATIAAPNILFNPAFGVEGIDFTHMRKQAVAYTDVLLGMGRMSQPDLAGQVTADRAARKAGTPDCIPWS
jgi:hypothetical protein